MPAHFKWMLLGVLLGVALPFWLAGTVLFITETKMRIEVVYAPRR